MPCAPYIVVNLKRIHFFDIKGNQGGFKYQLLGTALIY